jgi:hypothetical protein
MLSGYAMAISNFARDAKPDFTIDMYAAFFYSNCSTQGEKKYNTA